MALDDRDRSFERALALRLRANMSAADCPDAETLAAYHERSLTHDELTSWKAHIASCANCQQILAHLEALEEIPLGAVSGQEASSEVSNLVGAEATAGVTDDAPGAPATAPKSAAVVSIAIAPRQQHFTHWRWIAPLGAIAAGLIVWVVVHENRPAAMLPSAEIEIAQNRSSETVPKLAAPAPAEREKFDKSRSLSESVPSTGARASVSSALQTRRGTAASKSPASAPLAGSSEAVAVETQSAELSARAQAPQSEKIYGLAPGVNSGAGAAVGGIATSQKEKKFDESAQQDEAMNYINAPAPPSPAPKPQSARRSGVPSRQKDEKGLQANQSAGAPAAASAQTQQAPSNADAFPAKIPAMAETVVVTAAPPVAPASAAPSSSDELKQSSQDVNSLPTMSRSSTDLLTVTSGAEAAPASRFAKSRAPRTVAAPGGKVIWRLGFGGLIEQSLDGGHTWTPQTSGTTETLFLGSAPSEQVCWVISITGTILRTTDGGATWTPVVSPIPQNLGLIRASDALHATVWDMSRRRTFQTSDGGATWSPAPAH